MAQEIIIGCPHCQVRVKTSWAASVQGEGGELYFLVRCPSCLGALFGRGVSYMNEDEWELAIAERLWPEPPSADVAGEIPERARRDIKDAQKALSHGIYSAAAVLCRRALARLIRKKAGASMIGKGLADLKAKGVIDQRLFDWAEELRKERNLGSLASDDETTKENAQDLVDFTIAIFEYVYAVAEKHEKYVTRRSMVVAKSG